MTPCRPPRPRAGCGRSYRGCHGSMAAGHIAVIQRGQLDAIVRHYRDYYSDEVRDEMSYFGDTTLDLSAAITRACESKSAEGKLCSHQRRVGHAILATTVLPLQREASKLQACSSFEELHGVIETSILSLNRVGRLTVYDIAQRIGWYLGLSPEHVYLHAGVRAGARALGLNATASRLERTQFPIQLQQLSAAELEDVLCLYKDCF